LPYPPNAFHIISTIPKTIKNTNTPSEKLADFSNFKLKSKL